MSPKDEEDSEATAAERAFEALRDEVAALRQALRSVPEVILNNQPPDTTETLGAIAKELEVVGDILTAIEQHPAIRTTPAQYTHAITVAGEGLITQARRELEVAKSAAIAERRELAAMIGTMRGKWKQWEWLGWTGIGAFTLGVLISPILARALPFGWDGQVAAYIMRADRWNAGAALMEAQSPEAWHELAGASELVRSNTAAIGACRAAAATVKKSQRCTIEVPAAK
jgi:Family of unknown function (DUF6118)